MKKLENLKKAELIKLITEIRPKADAYDRVCKSVGVENNLLGFIKNLNIQNVSQQRELFVSFARFVANYKHSYATAYEDMFKEWLTKRNK